MFKQKLDCLLFRIAASCALLIMPLTLYASPNWGSYATPFSARSLWNAHPINPVLGTAVIPTSNYSPSVSTGAYSTGVFLANATDPAVVIYGPPLKPGIWNPDAESFYSSLTIPRWPANVVPASGDDGHADVVDSITGIVHSFWQLRLTNGKWTANQYAWSSLSGSGWGDPAHYFQGARASGVPTSAGLIRKQEINDGQPNFKHALAMSLTFNALASTPPYVFPATSADNNAATTNSGQIPEGTLLMLPPSFNTSAISSGDLRKVAETLKTYGAYVVDRNYGTPFVIYVENGSGYDLHKGGWIPSVATDLDRIRASLRPVVSVGSWQDGNGTPLVPQKNLNLLSMRGPWQSDTGSSTNNYDTWRQAIIFPATATQISQTNYSSRGLNAVLWALPGAGDAFRLTAITTGGGKLRFKLKSKTGTLVYDSGELSDAQVASFNWPVADATAVIQAISGTGGESSVSGELVRVSGAALLLKK